MREEIVGLVEIEMEVCGVGDSGDGFFAANEEVPAGSRFGAAEMLEGRGLFGGGHFRSVAVVEADKDDIIVAAGIEGEHAQAADYTLFELGAKHRATVIDKREKHRFLVMEIAVESDALAVFVGESRVERHLCI